MAITVSSTTETQEALQKAANHGLKTAQAAPEVETEEHPEADEAVTGAESETAQEEEEHEEPEEEDEDEEGQEKPPVGKTRKKLLRRLSRLHSENLTLQERLEAAEQKLRKSGPGEKSADATPQGKPSPKDYKDYEQYVEALADWKIQQRDQQRAQAAQDEYLKTIFDDYNQQVETARQTHDDYDDVVGTAAQVPMIAINAMYEMDNGAEVAYFLGQHADVRAQLLEWNQPGFKGGVRKMLAELDRISEDLSKGNKPSFRSNGSPARSKPATSAPAPIRPVGGGSSSRSTDDAAAGKLNYQDYKRWYAKKYGGR